MHAVIVSGGKQYRVEEGQYFRVAKIELPIGATVEFDQVLMVGEGEQVKIGAPYVVGCTVTAVIEEQGREDKIKIIKFKRRKHHMKRMGHRQWYTQIKITSINAAA